ncbi:nucleic acid-binding, OB-fold protein [Artemisia annua]|uniref:Nucleic acid-binding, OB-fold protein n=1 Tax=Artemisia annua TaxID=35608 RepID=A0A2U1NWQ8_ARTAN|nr:nucleic acid-binding, OB-fold protein [Artemisia annua]
MGNERECVESTFGVNALSICFPSFFGYKLVITIGTQDDDEINCVLFNTIANQLLGYKVEELLTKSIKEGADVPYWLDDFFVDKLIGRSIVLRIKIDKYNLAPTYVRRYTATKFYGDTVDVVKGKYGMISPPKLDSVNSKITDEDERIMDEIQWGSVSGSTTHTIPKTEVEVFLSTVHEVRDANVASSQDRSENVIKCETTTTIIDTFEGSPAHATMINEDTPSDTHKDIATHHVYNDAVDELSEPLKEADSKEFDTNEVVMMEVDMRQVDAKEAVMDEEDSDEAYVKKDDTKESQI